MKTIKVGINGFGRIGRAFLKIAWDRPEIELVAVNDLGDVANMAYLLKYDTVYREWKHPIRTETSNGTSYIIIDEKRVKVFAEKDPSKLPWKDLDVDVVVESTGLFTTYEKSKVQVLKKSSFLHPQKILRKSDFRKFLVRLFYLE